ncbi:MAG: hypothetical protein U1E89_09810 [Burkholderiaceae bacterium]
MSNARPTFEETRHDWHADPSNWRAGAMFQPKGLGVVWPEHRRRRHRTMMRALVLLSAGAAALAVLARVLHMAA